MVSITNIATTTTHFVGAYYEVTSGVATKYYYAGSQRIAMRNNGGLKFLVGDHLGSTSLTTDANGTLVSELRYKAWGEVRYESGATPTKYTYTGQYSYTSDFGLMFYNARWVDVSLGRFAQADNLVGDDRYFYVGNSPVMFTDPSGNRCIPENECNVPRGDKRPVPPRGLTSTGDGRCQRIGNSYCDGMRIWQVYMWYWEHTEGWWWDDGDFTPQDFFAMILMFEANGDEDDLSAIMEAASNQLWGTSSDRDAYCESQSCIAGLFNFMGAYMESAVRRWNALYDKNFNVAAGTDTYRGLTEQPTGTYQRLKSLGYSLQYVADYLFTQTFRNIDGYVPTDWGAPGKDPDLRWYGKFAAHNAPSGTTINCGLYHEGSDIVYTANQAATWNVPYPNCPTYP